LEQKLARRRLQKKVVESASEVATSAMSVYKFKKLLDGL